MVGIPQRTRNRNDCIVARLNIAVQDGRDEEARRIAVHSFCPSPVVGNDWNWAILGAAALFNADEIVRSER